MSTPGSGSWPRRANHLRTDSAAVDAFGRYRTGTPLTIFSSTLIHDTRPLDWSEEEVSGSGTSAVYNRNAATQTLKVSAATAGFRARRTKRRFVYQPGKSQHIVMTGFLGAGGPGITSRIGQFDTENGLFFQVKDGILSVVLRTNRTGTVQEVVFNQEDWNGRKFDGKDGELLDLDNANIFSIDYQWLGVGRVRFGLDVDGVLQYVHEIHNANEFTTAYMSTANLPCCYEIEADGTNTAAAEMAAICTTVITEGGIEDQGPVFTANSGTSEVNANSVGTRYAVIGIRQQSDFLDTSIDIEGFSILATSNANFYWELVLNPTVAGTFTFNDFPDSLEQIAIGNKSNPSSNTITNGVPILGGYSTGKSAELLVPHLEIPLGSTVSGVRDILVLTTTPLATNSDIYASLTWRELQ